MRDEHRANIGDSRIEPRANNERLPLELKANNTESGEAREKREGLPTVSLLYHDCELRRAARLSRGLALALALTAAIALAELIIIRFNF